MERDALVPVSGLHRLYVTGEKEKVVGNAREASILTSQCLECHTKGIKQPYWYF